MKNIKLKCVFSFANATAWEVWNSYVEATTILNQAEVTIALSNWNAEVENKKYDHAKFSSQSPWTVLLMMLNLV